MSEQIMKNWFDEKAFKKIALEIFLTLFVLLVFASALWLVGAIVYFTSTGGTYSVIQQNGLKACGIPFFTQENWFDVLLVFGVPILILIASIFLTRLCNSKILMGKLR